MSLNLPSEVRAHGHTRRNRANSTGAMDRENFDMWKTSSGGYGSFNKSDRTPAKQALSVSQGLMSLGLEALSVDGVWATTARRRERDERLNQSDENDYDGGGNWGRYKND